MWIYPHLVKSRILWEFEVTLRHTLHKVDWLKEISPRYEYVCECECMVPCIGLTSHPKCILASHSMLLGRAPELLPL